MTPPPPRGPDCPANAELEAYAAGEFPQLAAHIEGCASCQPYIVALREESAAFLRARPADLMLKKLEARRAGARAARPWWAGWLRAAVPAAVALVVTVGWWATRDDGVTLKGPPFRAFVKRGDAEAIALVNDAVVHEGDRVRFSYEAPEDGYLVVLDLDSRDAATVFYPWQGTSPAPHTRGATTLPGSVVLDAQLGPEWLVAVWAKKPFDVRALVSQLSGQATRDRVTLSCDGCQVTSLRVVKQK